MPLEPKRLLVVDDDETVCMVLATTLQARGYSVVAETDPHRAVGLIADGHFDVVLFDIVMPELDGIELTRQVREQFPALPIVIVTGFGSVDNTVQAMRGGATDFVTKPVEASLLDLRIRRAFEHEHTRRLANTDGLTGLYNHRHLQERLHQEVDRARRYGRPLSVMMADLDHFKRFNDTHGHPRGDQVLISVAQMLRQVSRAPDIVARYGGEEFTLVLPETDLAQAKVLAERTRACIEGLHFVGKNGQPEHVTISVGIANQAPGDDKETLVARADEALYRAKKLGRNRVCLAEDQATDTADNSSGAALQVSLLSSRLSVADGKSTGSS